MLTASQVLEEMNKPCASDMTKQLCREWFAAKGLGANYIPKNVEPVESKILSWEADQLRDKDGKWYGEVSWLTIVGNPVQHYGIYLAQKGRSCSRKIESLAKNTDLSKMGFETKREAYVWVQDKLISEGHHISFPIA